MRRWQLKDLFFVRFSPIPGRCGNPKVHQRLPDGTLVSPPLEDLAPFLPREELERQMFIPLVPEE